ncbi:MAG: hypothetical protein ACE5FV_11395 [Woeseia sp.]
MIIRLATSLTAVAMIVSGLYLMVFGNAWGPRAFELLPDTEFGFWVELIVPFLPMVFIGLGAALFVSRHQGRKASQDQPSRSLSR